VVAASSDFAAAFKWQETPSDVPLGRRDWVFLPEGEVVVIDRVRTDSAQRAAYLRFRTPARLTLTSESPPTATGMTGASAVAIHAVVLRPSVAPVITAVPASKECADSLFGSCTAARLPVHEYSLKLFGPDVLAVHVIDALGKGERAAEVASLNDLPVDGTPSQNQAVVGASISRATKQTFVIAAADSNGAAGTSMSYGVPGSQGARHVVFDAPEGAGHRTAVSATARGDRCLVTLAKAEQPASTSIMSRPAIFTVGPAGQGCKVAEDAQVLPGAASQVSGEFPTVNSAGGCACSAKRVRHKKKLLAAALLTGAFASIVIISRRRKSDRAD
jgi:hypothetical protein